MREVRKVRKGKSGKSARIVSYNSYSQLYSQLGALPVEDGVLRRFLGTALSACRQQHLVRWCLGVRGSWHDLDTLLVDEVRAAARCDEERVGGGSQRPGAFAVSACGEGQSRYG